MQYPLAVLWTIVVIGFYGFVLFPEPFYTPPGQAPNIAALILSIIIPITIIEAFNSEAKENKKYQKKQAKKQAKELVLQRQKEWDAWRKESQTQTVTAN